jgi:hypothetical protein
MDLIYFLTRPGQNWDGGMSPTVRFETTNEAEQIYSLTFTRAKRGFIPNAYNCLGLASTIPNRNVWRTWGSYPGCGGFCGEAFVIRISQARRKDNHSIRNHDLFCCILLESYVRLMIPRASDFVTDHRDSSIVEYHARSQQYGQSRRSPN